MTRRHSFLAGAVLAAAAACGSPPEELDTVDRDSFIRQADGQQAAQQALKAVDQSLAFDPTIDPAKTADQNA